LHNEKLNLIISKEVTKISSTTFVASSCSTNPTCEQASPNGDKRLDELLNAQKQHGDKTGLGFVSKCKNKKNNKKKNAQAPPLSLKKHVPFDENGEQTFEEEGELVKNVVGNSKRGMPNHNDFVRKYNPSYVICRAYDGHVYAKFVGSQNEYTAWSILVPKTLVTNKRGPIEKWGPKSKT
jgi:hypothetical protein